MGSATHDADNRVSYGFKQPYVSGLLTLKPTRKLLVRQRRHRIHPVEAAAGRGILPVDRRYFRRRGLAGIGAKVNYLHTQVGVGLDWRQAEEYARRGGYYGITVHEYNDDDDQFGFREVQYEAIQHVPILREAWVLSFRGRVTTSSAKTDQRVPFFMTPSLGSGSTLRAYPTRRFRGEDTLLLQAEWRIMVNRFMDTAILLRRRQGRPRRRGSGLRPFEDRRRVWCSIPCALPHAAAHGRGERERRLAVHFASVGPVF